jgi:hypothetical protein
MLCATARLRSTTGDGATSRRTQGIRAAGAAQGFGALQRREAAADQEAVPTRPILLGQRNRRAVGRGAGGEPRGLDFHQREQAQHLRLVGHRRGENAAQAAGLGAQAGPDRSSPAVAA